MSEEKDVDHASVHEGVSEREALWLWMMRRNASEPVTRTIASWTEISFSRSRVKVLSTMS